MVYAIKCTKEDISFLSLYVKMCNVDDILQTYMMNIVDHYNNPKNKHTMRFDLLFYNYTGITRSLYMHVHKIRQNK